MATVVCASFLLIWAVFLCHAPAVKLQRKSPPYSIRTLEHYFNRDTFGGYTFKFRNTDGTSRYENAIFVGGVLSVMGTYSYRDGNGDLQTVRYVSDENGYRTVKCDRGWRRMRKGPPDSFMNPRLGANR
ncbi:larval cuticle protein 1-like [Cimex lectularius]|uniref:CPR type cuticle protein n=1 Tax=Cimex lectularius TaxID=79782 RepID=A0A8I6TH60_CIMLE|nr:larval cuticle protein 1-like [Cimex lectularius]